MFILAHLADCLSSHTLCPVCPILHCPRLSNMCFLDGHTICAYSDLLHLKKLASDGKKLILLKLGFPFRSGLIFWFVCFEQTDRNVFNPRFSWCFR